MEYHYGDFKYDPLEVLRSYFDAFLYFANWGTLRLAFHLPADRANIKALQQYKFWEGV